MKRTKIVCLCGSTRHKAAFEDANRRETLAGNNANDLEGEGLAL